MYSLSLTRKNLQIILALCGLVLANIMLIAHAFAVTYMTRASVLEYNMNAGGTSQVAVAFTAGAADVAGTLTVNFGAWGGTVNSTQTVTTTNCTTITGASTALPSGTSLAAAGAGSTVTVSNVSALTSGTSYCFILNAASAVTNPASTGVYPVVLTDATDSATVGINVITNDQVVVSATVPPTFTMSLSGNTDSFGNLSATGLTTTGGVTATVSTNGNYGWFLSALDSQAGLRSATQSKTISSVATGSNTTMNGGSIGTEKYALGVTTGNATANYANAGGITGGGLSTSVYNQVATGNAAASGATVTIKELADISATTPAASDYSDTVSIVGAGSF